MESCLEGQLSFLYGLITLNLIINDLLKFKSTMVLIIKRIFQKK
jgi:hypothetical protein